MYSYYSLLFVSFSLKSKNLLRFAILNYSIYIFSDNAILNTFLPCFEWILLIFLFSLKCSSGGEKVIQKKLNLLSTIFVCNYGFQWRGKNCIIKWCLKKKHINKKCFPIGIYTLYVFIICLCDCCTFKFMLHLFFEKILLHGG